MHHHHWRGTKREVKETQNVTWWNERRDRWRVYTKKREETLPLKVELTQTCTECNDLRIVCKEYHRSKRGELRLKNRFVGYHLGFRWCF